MIRKISTQRFLFTPIRYNFTVRVRYAPSPTGPLHLGAIRTALYNYLFARKNKGKFIIRIEDTDQERNVEGSVQDIFKTLQWLGIDHDESIKKQKAQSGPYIQSQRLNFYKKMEKALLKNNYAYPCFCENIKGKKQNKLGVSQYWYDGKCRSLTLQQVKQKIQNKEPYAIRIKSDISEIQVKSFIDEVYGFVEASSFDDFIIVKKNGWPTFHFANVLDDWMMQITHVIRGQQWLSNTPKHIYLYRILGYKPPRFMHLPLLLTQDGKKLSKRDPSSPINLLKQKGYQPQAIINYAGLLGFNPQNLDKEKLILSLQDFQNIFTQQTINKKSIKIQAKQLNFFNKSYILKKWKDPKNSNVLKAQMVKYIRNVHKIPQQKFDQKFIIDAIDIVIERITNYQDLTKYGYFFNEINYQNLNNIRDFQLLYGKGSRIRQNRIINADKLKLQKNNKVLNYLIELFRDQSLLDEIEIAKKISHFMFENSREIANEVTYNVFRFAITGKKDGPNILKTCLVMGNKEVQKRLQLFASLSEQKNYEIRK